MNYYAKFDYYFFQVDENMKIAQKRNAVLEQKFWFRDDIQNKGNKSYSLMTVDEIMNGKEVSRRRKIYSFYDNLNKRQFYWNIFF